MFLAAYYFANSKWHFSFQIEILILFKVSSSFQMFAL